MSAAEDAVRIAEACVVHPGDTLVLALDRSLSNEQFAEYKEIVKRAMPDSVKVLMVGPTIHLHVLRSGEVAE